MIKSKFIIFMVSALFINSLVLAQSVDRNYVRHDKYLSSSNCISMIQYYDGIGRQTVNVVNSNGSENAYLYSAKNYFYGQMVSMETLPVQGSSNPVFIPCSTLTKMTEPLYGSDSRPFTVYDYDGLNRNIKTQAPGDNWYNGGHFSRSDYDFCGSNEVLKFDEDLSYSSYYANGALKVESSTDEDGKKYCVYKDILDRVIMERHGTDNDTYYVYSSMGLLLYVLPPAISKSLGTSGTVSQEVLAKYGYSYYYDQSGHCIGKTLPGCQRENYKLDKGNRVVFSQTGNLLDLGLWNFDLYDSNGRLAIHGVVAANGGVNTYDGHVITASYTGVGRYDGWDANVNLSNYCILRTNYYDDYDFLTHISVSDNNLLAFAQRSSFPASPSDAAGMPTGVRIRNISDAITASNINTVLPYIQGSIYYDAKGHVIQSRTTNILGGIDVNMTDYNLISGSINSKYHMHMVPGKPDITEIYQYAHDSADRVSLVTYSLNGEKPITMSEYTYDDLGRVKTKKIAESEIVSYSYNIRGWRTKINSSHFDETLAYESSIDGLSPSAFAFNGNISAMRWKSGNETVNRGYSFTYDDLDRMTTSVYGESTDLSNNPNRYDENLTYDNMGNIQTLRRMGLHDDKTYGLIDNLSYNYDGNHLIKVTDAVDGPYYQGAMHFRDGSDVATEYEYDKNGNMTKDLNKGISKIEYNSLNLPLHITHNDGNMEKYTYGADGTKLSVKYGTLAAGVLSPMTSIMKKSAYASSGSSEIHSTYYCGNIIYDGDVTRILTEEGFVTLTGSIPSYHYFLKDHLGNNRVVLSQNGTVEQVNHYYPFGGLFGESTNGDAQPYKYNGKELDRMNGLDWYDYGARQYDATLAQWATMDPLCEKDFWVSPYVYCMNNPVRFIDPDGREVDIEHRTGFLGFGKKETLKYDNGNLYNKDGSPYIGKVNGFLKKTVNALGSLNQTKEGCSIITELQSSSNVFTIKSGATNEFKADNPFKAGANLKEVQAAIGNTVGSMGSGGTIFWSSSSTSGGFDLSGGTIRPTYISLGHEMAHGSDANQGLLYFSSDYINGETGAQYQSTYQGLLKSEWRAVYRENLIRGESGIPLRTNYGIDMSTGIPLPADPRLLDATNQPLNYP